MDNQQNPNNAFAHLFKNAPQPRPTPPPEASLNPPRTEEQHKPTAAETGGLESTAATKLSTSAEPMVQGVPNMPVAQDGTAMPKPRPSDFGIVPKKKPKKAAKPAKKAKKAAKKGKKALKKKVVKKAKKKALKKAAKKTPKKSVVKKGKKKAAKTKKMRPVKKAKKTKKAPPKKKKAAKGKKRR